MLIRHFLLLLMLCLLTVPCLGEALILPQQTLQIDDEAFLADTAVSNVVLPDGLQSIGSRAFAVCTELREITIPASVTKIGESAFLDCHDGLLIRTAPNSIAMKYAINNHLDYRADTTCRALVFAQNKYQYGLINLPGTVNDADAMQRLLPNYGFSVTRYNDLTAEGIDMAIADTFKGAKIQDISLIYYSGHGMSSNDPNKLGALCGVDGVIITGSQLRTWLDKIPGRKIVILDSCFSGNLIGRSTLTAADYAAMMIAPFTMTPRSAELAANNYFVITAAHSTQQSYESTNIYGINGGLFTQTFVRLCSGEKPSADADADGVITLDEAYRSVSHSALGLYQNQAAQVYPSDCTWFGLFRK